MELSFFKRGLETIYLIIYEYSGSGCEAAWAKDAAVERQGRIYRVSCDPSRNTTVTTGDSILFMKNARSLRAIACLKCLPEQAEGEIMTPVFSWLRNWRQDQLEGILVDIFITDAAGNPMRHVDQVKAIAGVGLDGDRYAKQMGYWRQTDACQVTLVTEEDLRRAERSGRFTFADGQHRRNLVVRGIPLDAFRRRRVRVGEALLAYHRLRPPCGYLDRLLKPGAGKALGRGAGIGFRVIEGGMLRVGDAVSVIAEPVANG